MRRREIMTSNEDSAKRKWGQGAKSLVRGMGMKSPNVIRARSAISKNRSGAEGDYYDSDTL